MRQPFRHQIAAWALTAALTLTLQAADGVIEINQAIVEANGGFPYVISEPGSYNLTGNLTVPDENTSAIEVQARYVTLDLNGFAIIGPAQCTAENGSVTCSPQGTGTGVFASIGSLTVVRNGSVRGMGLAGVSIFSGRVEGIRALGNGCHGIFLQQAGGRQGLPCGIEWAEWHRLFGFGGRCRAQHRTIQPRRQRDRSFGGGSRARQRERFHLCQ